MNDPTPAMIGKDAFPGSARLIARFAGEDSDTVYDLSQVHPAAPLNPEILITNEASGGLGLIVRVNPDHQTAVVHLSIRIRFSESFSRVSSGVQSIQSEPAAHGTEPGLECDGQPIVYYPGTPGRNLVVKPAPHQFVVRARATLNHDGVAGLEWVCCEDRMVPVSITPGERDLFRCRIESMDAREGNEIRPVEVGDRLEDAAKNQRDHNHRFCSDRLLKGLVFASLFPWMAMVAMVRWIGSFRRISAREGRRR